MKQYKLLTNLDPRVQVFLAFCVTKWKFPLTFAACGRMKSICAVVWLVSWKETFFLEHHFYLKRMTNCGYLDLDIWQSLSQKWTKWACHFKENSWQYFVANDKMQAFKQEWKFQETCVCHSETASQYLNSSGKKNRDVLTQFFLILSDELCQHLEDLHNLSFSVFSRGPVHDVL